MILVDTNLLLYAQVVDLPAHEAAKTWLESVLAGPARVGLPWESLIGFLRIRTNPRVFARPLSSQEAWSIVCGWLALPVVWVPQPTERHADVLSTLINATHPAAGLVHDAHLAALAIEHGLVLHSTDTDFARFPGLRWEDPIHHRHPSR